PSLFATEVSMALDDVVARALSKEPGDRYPSAGDLGRAAVAALSGERPTLPERTVATGAAATRESRRTEPPVEASSSQPEPPTRRLAGDRARRGRRFALPVLAAAVAAALAIGALALAGGGEGGDDAGSGDEGRVLESRDARNAAAPEPAPQTLTRSELIARADAVCERSQRRYKAVRDLESEYTTDVPYAEALVRFARARIRGLDELTPPSRLAGPYGEYVAAQERVLGTDEEALAAARQGDAAGVQAARERRDSEDALRERLAGQIGFEVCSTRQG
ncbi:MAG TPA: hypothetical protein VFU04_03990, partial [Solirubrobacterales bacterium]|nr:hypothetical protein [Solirubrobacterales bacterium]